MLTSESKSTSSLRSICHAIDKKTQLIKGLRGVLTFKILSLPDNNTDIKWINRNPKCFTVKSSVLAKDWTPTYQDFKAQYQLVVDYLNSVEDTTQIIDKLAEVLNRGILRLKSGRTQRLHLKVIENVRGILE